MSSSSPKYTRFNEILNSQDFDDLYVHNSILFEILAEGSKLHVQKLTELISLSIKKNFKFTHFISSCARYEWYDLKIYFDVEHSPNYLLADRFPSWIEAIVRENEEIIAKSNDYFLRDLFGAVVFCCTISMNYDECFRIGYYLSTITEETQAEKCTFFDHEDQELSFFIYHFRTNNFENIINFATYIHERHGVEDFVWSAKGDKMNVCNFIETGWIVQYCTDFIRMGHEHFVAFFNISGFAESYKSRFEQHHHMIIAQMAYFDRFEFLKFLFEIGVAKTEHFNYAFEIDLDDYVLCDNGGDNLVPQCFQLSAPPLKVIVFE